jgi:hypothetical protein
MTKVPTATPTEVRRIRTLFAHARPAYSIAEGAAILGMSEDEIRRELEQGSVTTLRFGGDVRIAWADLVWLGLVHRWTYRTVTPAVPFCHLAFSAARPPERRYERVKVPHGTLGGAFRQRRWARGLQQSEAAKDIGISVKTYCGMGDEPHDASTHPPPRRHRLPRL